LYSRLAKYYDAIYWWKDYSREVDFLVEVFERYEAMVKTILEVACGTGNHTKIFVRKGYRVTGLDINEEVLKVARKKVGHGAEFVRGDMRDLGESVGGEFDAVVCLFSAISYNRTLSELERTIQGFYDHLKAGGVAVFDTHFTKKGFMDGFRDESVFDDGDVIGARVGVSTRRGNLGEISFTYLIKDGRKVITLRDDVHRLGLFDAGEFLRALRRVGFAKTRFYADWSFEKGGPKGQFGDYIFVGQKPRHRDR